MTLVIGIRTQFIDAMNFLSFIENQHLEACCIYRIFSNRSYPRIKAAVFDEKILKAALK